MVKSIQLHPWNVSVKEARDIQVRLAAQVSRCNGIPELASYVAGMDISPPDAEGMVRAAAVVMSSDRRSRVPINRECSTVVGISTESDLPNLQIVEVKCAQGKPGFPYVPGLLSFREAPLALEALQRLTITPDFLLADGQGLAHPRRFGLACHLGLLTGLPTIGCAKSILVGRHGPLGQEKGLWSPLEDRGDVVGAALRTREGVTPVYVSIGHKVDLPSAIRWALACCARFRLPEPTRLAHHAAAGRLQERKPAKAETRV